MKRWVVVTVLVMALVAVIAGTALAANPAPTPATGNAGWTCAGMGAGRGMGGGLGWDGMSPWMGLPAEVEELLGLTDAEIHAERLAGKSLVQIAESKGVSEETLVNTILDAKKAELDELVADGKLTQAQADTMYRNMQQTVPVTVNRTGIGPMMGTPGQGQANPSSGSEQRGGGRGRTGGRWA